MVKSKSKNLFPTFISSIPHHKHVFRTAGKYTFYIAICVFLFLNIFLSRLVSPLYFQIVNDDQKAFVYYLQSIKNLSWFSSELSRLKNTYGNRLENDVFSKEIEEKRLIQNYEQILEKNAYSRDILYSLYLLYNQKGDKIMGEKYLIRAKTIDPMVR